MPAVPDPADRSGPTGSWLRWVRASITAGVALSLGALAHTTAGGLLPAAPVMVALAGLCVLGCWLLLARPASTSRLVVLVVAVQTLGHGVLTALAGHAGTTERTTTAASAPTVGDRSTWGSAVAALGDTRRTGSLRELTAVDLPGSAPAPGAADWVTHLVQTLTGPPAAMALAHLVAAAVLGAWLAGGERALWTLTELGSQSARAATARTVAALRESGRWGAAVLDAHCELGGPRRADPARAAYDVRPVRWAELRRAASRRGPPVLLAFH